MIYDNVNVNTWKQIIVSQELLKNILIYCPVGNEV